MKETIKKNIPLFLLVMAGLVVLAVISANVFDTAEEPAGKKLAERIGDSNDTEKPIIESQNNEIAEPAEKLHLRDVIDDAYFWAAAYNDWFGRKAPDMTLTDLQGKNHSLSEYKGKDIILIFWATWCGPCKEEIPHLKELRKEKSEDELVILAVTNETRQTVEPFARKAGINYSVLLSDSQMPAPYSQIQGIPSAFFIDQQGDIKLGTIGMVPLEDIKKILNASWKTE